MSFPVAIVSDCGGQAAGRMSLRVSALLPDAVVTTAFESTCLAEASGNIVDAVDAMLGRRGAVLCNSAPRRAEALCTNGSDIVFGRIKSTWVVATLCTLSLPKKIDPNLKVRRIRIPDFMSKHVNTDRHTFNFRGLEVIPFVAEALKRHDGDLNDVSDPLDDTAFPTTEPLIWLADTIEGVPYNIKLSHLCSDFPELTTGHSARVLVGEDRREFTIPRYERLTNIPKAGDLGIYESSSGFGDKRWLEVAVLDGSAAQKLGVKAGDRFEIIEVI